jgi:hypothetical protein
MILRTAQQDVASADKLSVNVELRNRWPLTEKRVNTIQSIRRRLVHSREFLDALSELGILEDIICLELLGRNALNLQHLHSGFRETALRPLWGTLHKQDNW